MSEDRPEAMNPGPNSPVSEAEALREETVAERVNPGDPGAVTPPFPEQKAERINPGPNTLDADEVQEANGGETLDSKEHRIDPGPQR